MLFPLPLRDKLRKCDRTQHLPTSAPIADVTVFIFSTCSIPSTFATLDQPFTRLSTKECWKTEHWKLKSCKAHLQQLLCFAAIGPVQLINYSLPRTRQL